MQLNESYHNTKALFRHVIFVTQRFIVEAATVSLPRGGY